MILLLVEDEPYTREGIVNAIDWAALGISTVLTAEDGQKGLEMARRYLPDIVLTDMFMPKTDGSSMAKSIREILPGCSMIFMSGYSDISYYKSAIQVSAVDFINKPLKIDELINVLKKCIKHTKNNKEKNESFFFYKSNELAVYIINENADRLKLMELWKGYGLPYGENYKFRTIILKQTHSEWGAMHINELAKESDICISVGNTENGYVIHAAFPRMNSADIDNFCQSLLRDSSNEITYLALGKPVDHPTKLKESYIDAINLSKLSFFYPERRFFKHGETSPSLVNEYNQVKEISQLLYLNSAKAKQWVENQFKKMRNHSGTPIELVKYWGFKMCTELYFHLNRIKKDNIQSIPTDESELWDKISSLDSLDELKNLVIEIIGILDCSLILDANPPLIWEVQRYIYNNLSKPLTLTDISEHVHLSATYACSLFKEKTGQTINQYILDARIHRAKLMLESTNMHINEIAEAIGFSSSSYFIKVFRKVTGITPQEYRKENKVI